MKDKYFKFNKNKIIGTRSLTPTINVDIDKDGNVVGIEVLNFKK